MSPRTVFTPQDVYEFIIKFSKENGYVPSLKDMSANFQWKSRNAANKHIRRLEKSGMIEKTPRGGIKFPSSLRK